MGKKGNWFTALKRAFTSSSKDKDKLIDASEKKNIKEKKKWGFGRSKHGEINSFIPLFRKPSSIEEILCDAERDQLHRIQQAPQKKVQPLKSNAPAHARLLATAPKPLITPNYVQMSAIKIQAAYRGYLPSLSSSSRRSDHHPSAASAASLRDDDSLTSCPAFTLPNYMVPTASAKAKVRSSLAADHEGKRRFSFGLGQSIGSLRWSPFAAGKDAGSQRTGMGKHKKTFSVGGLSVDSTLSLPAGVGRRPFK
ncbi:hypothetical protein COCNU_01G022040 [Cocos nucifera]|uniref:Uncharacterized protein n=1 Tax=Cocos nucifera TaxID=13894 RepID=A0A8K0MW97_COCNU|nr:hypothetical protein COCNU_01G022040 [Cocos nucifera]